MAETVLPTSAPASASASAPATSRRVPAQPMHVLAAWIHELVGDVQQAQLQRLSELRDRLRSDTFDWNDAAVVDAASALRSEGRALRLDGLCPTWLQRLAGSHRRVNSEFISAWHRLAHHAARFRAEAFALSAAWRLHAPAAHRLVIEIDMEWNSLQAEVDQGVGWLEDLCLGLELSRERGDDPARLGRYAERTQRFTQELKRLQSAATLACELRARAHALLERRLALLDLLRGDLLVIERSWAREFASLAADLRVGRTPSAAHPRAQAAHDALMLRLGTTLTACAAMEKDTATLAQQLDELQRVLQAGA